MAPITDDECPVCLASISQVNGGSNDAKESHIAACVESHFSSPPSAAAPAGLAPKQTQPRGELSQEEDGDSCPICHTSFLTKESDGNDSVREAHFSSCFDSQTSAPAEPASKRISSPPAYHRAATFDLQAMSPVFEKGKLVKPPPANATTKPEFALARSNTTPSQAGRRQSVFRGILSSLGGDSKTKERKAEEKTQKCDNLMRQRWGPPGNPTSEMILRYWRATRMQQHWEFLRMQHPRQFRKYMDKGYMEPIPTEWVRNRKLAWIYPEPSYWETPAEKRLYYLLNNGAMVDGSTHPVLRPLNINRDMYTIIRRGNERNARQVHLDYQKLAAYQSPGDVFQSDKQIQSHRYSDQVPNIVYAPRTAALHELADGILHGTDHLETMLLLDVSGSMTWNPHQGMVGPDGIRRFHDQPSNIRLVEHLVHRVLNHMIPRAQKEHPTQTGIDAVTFSTYGRYIGQLSSQRFPWDWRSKVQLGGGTQVMQGWQTVKQTYFAHQNRTYGHGRWDPVFGWQATRGMPKLSLLVFLDGEATDMDEFELELLGETWAYVTIALVGMENCPHHHSHAVELERVAKFNPHVGFFDVHGRVCERMVVEDLLASVYPVDPPQYSEILKPEFDLPKEELPAYSVD